MQPVIHQKKHIIIDKSITYHLHLDYAVQTGPHDLTFIKYMCRDFSIRSTLQIRID